MPHTEKEINTLGSDGTAFMPLYLNETKKFELLNIKSPKEIEQYPLAINRDLVFQRFNLLEDYIGSIMCAGCYCFKMTTKGVVSDIWDLEFPLELIKQCNTERE